MTSDDESARDNPRKATYRQYRQYVKTHADAAEEALAEYPEDFETAHEAVRHALQGAHWPNNGGLALVVNLMSHQDPDVPDYCGSWTQYVDLDSDPTWSEVVGAMARVCLESDVFEELDRRRQDDERDFPSAN